jgi:hypothetical protein
MHGITAVDLRRIEERMKVQQPSSTATVAIHGKSEPMKNQMIQSRTSQLFARGSLGAFHLLPSGAGSSQSVAQAMSRLRAASL